MRTDATLAVELLAPASTWRPAAMVLLGLGTLLSGLPDAADDIFADVADAASDLGAPDMAPVALAERALIAIDREEWVRESRPLAEHGMSGGPAIGTGGRRAQRAPLRRRGTDRHAPGTGGRSRTSC